MPVTRCFERVYLDGVELEQAVVMDDDWALPGGKMKSVVCIDALSSFVFEPCTFAGPYRSETSMQALSNMMTPPILTDEEYAEDPELAWANGVPNTLVPDNAQTLIGPGHVPGLNELGITLELLGTYHHDAKSPIENFNKYLKQSLRGLPGTIRGPRQPKHPQDDPLADASLTREALAQIVKSVVRKWNTTPKAPLGNRSPAQFLHADLLANPRPLRCNPDKTRRALAKTVNGRILTGDGVEYDGIVYRGELDIEDFIERNLRNTAFADRLPDEGKCIVSIRVYEGDLDLIEVYDPEALGFITLRSTQPAYTGMLTKWEHDQYKALAKRRKEQFKTEDQRIRSRTRSLAEIDRLAPEVSFQARAAMVALYANEKVRRLSGAKGETKGYVCPIPEMFFEIEPATELRQDLATPPPGAVNPPPKKKHFAPERIDGFHSGEAGGDNASFSWDDLADDDQAGPVPNESNATVWDDETIDEEDDE